MSRGPDLAKREVWRRRLREFDRGTATVAGFAGGQACRWRRSINGDES
jgi:hypothetical protein